MGNVVEMPFALSPAELQFDPMDMFPDRHKENSDTTTEQPKSAIVDGMGNASGCFPSSKEHKNMEESYVKLDIKQDVEQVDDKTARAIIESQIQHNHQLEDQVKQLKDQVQQLKDQVQQSKEQQKAMLDEKIKIQQEFYELRESSRELTEKMASLSSSDPRFENTNDKTSPSKIGKLSDSIFHDDWFKAYESLEQKGFDERELLKRLSEIIEMCYKKCGDKSESTLRQFLLLSETDDLPSYSKMHQLYMLRKSACHETWKRQTLIAEISSSITEAKESKEEDTESKSTLDQQGPLHRYVSRCTELCWLAVTSSPPLKIVFNVNGRDYREIKTQFSQHSASDPVYCDTDDCLGKVAMVVWPALISSDNKVYDKGTVLVFDKVETHI